MVVLSVVALSLALFSLASSEIPEYIHVCHRRDPRVASCIKDSIEYLRPQLAQGLPELGVPGIDPLNIEKITIFEGPGQSGTYAYLDNMVVNGASNFVITKLKLDVNKMTYRLGVKIPFLDITGKYDINVELFQNPIKEIGDFHANASGIDGQGILQGRLENNHLTFESFNLKVRVDDFNIDVGSLFNSNPTINKLVKNMFNNGKGDLLRMALPVIERKVTELALQMGNKITMNLDYDEVFPE